MACNASWGLMLRVKTQDEEFRTVDKNARRLSWRVILLMAGYITPSAFEITETL